MLDYRVQSLWCAPSVNIFIRRYLCWIKESSVCGGHLQLILLFGGVYIGL